jgi:hypothetical protein
MNRPYGAKECPMDLKVIAAKEAMVRYEGWKSAKTWDAMVAAVAVAGGISRKIAEIRLERKYGHMFCGRIK